LKRPQTNETWLIRIGSDENLTKVLIRGTYVHTVEVSEVIEGDVVGPKKYYAWNDIDPIERIGEAL
jgi:hypothetical protein